MVRKEGGRKVGKRLLVDEGDDKTDEPTTKLLINDPSQPRPRMIEIMLGDR